jgi:hypothetical protein
LLQAAPPVVVGSILLELLANAQLQLLSCYCSQDLVISLALDVARGMAHLHTKNVVHG